MVDWIERCFDYLGIPEQKRKKIAYRVRRNAQEKGITDNAGMYLLIIEQVEATSIPYSERFVLSLDSKVRKDDKRLLHEVIPTPEEDEVDPQEAYILLSDLPKEYASILAEIGETFGESRLEVFVNKATESVEQVRERLRIVQKRKEENVHISPPERPVRRVYFTSENELIIEVGRMKEGYDPVAYYDKYYSGVTRGHLQQYNQSLYAKLWKLDLLDHIPIEQPEYADDPIGYYYEHYSEFSRGQLHRVNTGFYLFLLKRGFLEQIPLRDKSKPFKRRKNRGYGKDPLAFCRENYPDITRGRLGNVDKSLYTILDNAGLLDQIPLDPNTVQNRRDYGGDPLNYYVQHHLGVSRGKLPYVNKPLYHKLRNLGKIEMLPKKDLLKIVRRTLSIMATVSLEEQLQHIFGEGYKEFLPQNIETKEKRSKYDPDPVAYYQQHYQGVTRGQLQRMDQGLYMKLYRTGNLFVVPLLR